MPGEFRDELFNGIREAWCTALEYGGNFLDALPDPLVDSSQVPIARMNRGLYRMFCNREPPAAYAPPFEGGQCPVTYRVYWRLFFQSQPGATVTQDDLMGYTAGPIGEFELRITNPPYPSATLYGIRSTDGAAYPLGGSSTGSLGVPLGDQTRFEILSIVRNDGAPDDCGDPPEVPVGPPQPDYNDIDIDINYSPHTGPDITVPVNFIFAPVRVNLNGEVNIPVKIDIGNINVPITGNLNINNPSLNLNFGNPNYAPTDKPTPDRYDSPDDTPDNPPDVPEPVTPPLPTVPPTDTKRIIRACIVTVSTVSPTNTVIGQGDNPDIYAPNLGFISFYIAIASKTSWTSDIPVKNKRNFIVCPWEGGALAVKGTPRPGVSWTISPVYALVDESLEYDV